MHALHKGFNDAGLHAISEFIVDKDGRYLQNTIDNNPFVSDDTVIYHGTLEEIEPGLLKEVHQNKGLDAMNVSLPCTGQCRSGKASNKIVHTEEHKDAGTAFVGQADLVVAAWSNDGKFLNRGKALLELFKGKKLHCLDINLTGHPNHPLYCKKSLQCIPYEKSSLLKAS